MIGVNRIISICKRTAIKLYNRLKDKATLLIAWSICRKVGITLYNWLSANATLIMALAMIASVWLSYISLQRTMDISTRQLKQSNEFYELQNRPNVSIEKAWWYPLKVLSGDTGLRLRMRVVNYGKIPTSEAKIAKDIVLRINTDTLSRFPNFIEDVARTNEELNIDKERRVVEQYMPYRTKPFKEISNYIIENKGEVTGEGIIRHFSEEYTKKGYQFIKYNDISYTDYLVIRPGDIELETGRSVSVEGFENEIFKDGGDILIFYYAIQYTGPLRIKKYTTHYIGCYDSLQGTKEKDWQSKYPFTYGRYFFDEVPIASVGQI